MESKEALRYVIMVVMVLGVGRPKQVKGKCMMYLQRPRHGMFCLS